MSASALQTELDLARQEEASGEFESAHSRLLALRREVGDSWPELEIRLAWAKQHVGQSNEALEVMRQVVRRFESKAIGHSNLAALFAAQDRMTEAREVLRRATNLLADASLWIRLASIETHFGERAKSLSALASAAALIPDSPELWAQLGNGYAEHWQYELADRALRIASALDPGMPDVEAQRAFVRGELGDVDGALKALETASRRNPTNLRVAVSQALILPQVYESADDVERWRGRYERGMGELERRTDDWLRDPDQVFSISKTNFLLAYQGRDDKALQERYAAFLGTLSAAAKPEWRHPLQKPRRQSGRLRIGFAGSLFRDCTAGRYFERWITGLDERFERFVYHMASVRDEVTERIAKSAEHFFTLRGGATEIAPKVLEHELDVLVYPEVGMDPTVSILSVLRLAPVQLAGWGHPVTTGSDVIDGFITCDAMEPANADTHYVERLIRLPGLGVQYARPNPVKAIDRRQLGGSDDRRLYVCPQALFKIHPDVDQLFADVLERDPGGVLLLFQGASTVVTDMLACRIQRTLRERGLKAQGQVKFLPRVDSAKFRAVLAAADVVLDTLYWSGGNTSLDSLSTGTPVVTMPGDFMRGRQTYGMLQMMGLTELVAADRDDYSRIAVDVARHRERNNDLRRQIVRSVGELFDQRVPMRAFADSVIGFYEAGRA